MIRVQKIAVASVYVDGGSVGETNMFGREVGSRVGERVAGACMYVPEILGVCSMGKSINGFYSHASMYLEISFCSWRWK